MSTEPEREAPAPERADRIAECIGLVGGELMDEPRAAEAMAEYERLRKRYDEALEALRMAETNARIDGFDGIIDGDPGPLRARAVQTLHQGFGMDYAAADEAARIIHENIYRPWVLARVPATEEHPNGE